MQEDLTISNIIEFIKNITNKEVHFNNTDDSNKVIFSYNNNSVIITRDIFMDYIKYVNNFHLDKLEDISINIAKSLNIL